MAQTTPIYANTIAKYNEGKLLSEEKLRRLAEADFSGAVKMLCDYGYGDGIVTEQSYDADKFIARETARLVDYVRDDCPSQATADVLLAQFYYNNAKTCYKSRFLKKSVISALYTLGEDYTSDILSGDYSGCPHPMAEALKSLDDRAAAGETLSAREIDVALTRAMYADMSAKSKRAGRAVRKYVTAKIDFSNLSTVLRCKRLNSDKRYLDEMLIDGGTLDRDLLEQSFETELSVFAEKFRDTVYYDALRPLSERGLDYLPELESEAEAVTESFFDVDLENMLSDAPFLHYFSRRLSEFRKVKIILTCIKNGARGEIARRVRFD